MIAAFKKQISALKILLKRGAEVDVIESQDGQTALMAAVICNSSESVALLIKYGANKDLEDVHKCSASQYANLLHLTPIVELMTKPSDLVGQIVTHE
jgi:ankyrin repeat protein